LSTGHRAWGCHVRPTGPRYAGDFVTDRFNEPERSSQGDPRRVFIPAPAAPRGGTSTRPPGAPPRPDRVGGAAGRGVLPPPQRTRPSPDDDRRFSPGDPADRPPSAPPRPPVGGRPWYRRLRWRRVFGLLSIVLVLALLGGYLYARSIFNRIEKVDLGDSLTAAESGTNYLIVGSDSRENVTEEGDAGFNGSEAPGGQRADSIMIVHIEGGKAQMLSVPRDLYLPIAGTDGSQKINAAYNADLGGGPERLVDTITQSLDIPIDRYMEIDFVSFAGLVDALGGVTINFPNPAQDEASGLYVPEAGDVELDGDQALAYVRSRHYTESINGELVEDPTGDLGRITRQQTFLSVVFDKLSGSRNPITMLRVASGMAEGLRIDDEMSMFDAFRLVWGLRGLEPAPLTLTTTNDRNDAGAVLILDEEASQPALDAVR
jgi:LCP family protein required for cell wall assembly